MVNEAKAEVGHFEGFAIYALLRKEPTFPGYEPLDAYQRWQDAHLAWEAEVNRRRGVTVSREDVTKVAKAILDFPRLNSALQKAGRYSPLSPADQLALEDFLDDLHREAFRFAEPRTLRFSEAIIRRLNVGEVAQVSELACRPLFDRYYRGDVQVPERIACSPEQVQFIASLLIQNEVLIEDLKDHATGWDPEEIRDPDNRRYQHFQSFMHLQQLARYMGGYSYCEPPEPILILKFVSMLMSNPEETAFSDRSLDFLRDYRPAESRFASLWNPDGPSLVAGAV